MDYISDNSHRITGKTHKQSHKNKVGKIFMIRVENLYKTTNLKK